MQSWLLQQRHQQRTLRSTNELSELKKLIDEITFLADSRNYRARKLIRNIGVASEEKILDLRKEYDAAVTAWNDKWNSFCISLTLYAKHYLTIRLEEEIQVRFADVGHRIDKAFVLNPGRVLSTHKLKLENDLNILSGKIFSFSRDLLNIFLEKQNAAYEEERKEFNCENLELFSTFDLVKLLFKPL